MKNITEFTSLEDHLAPAEWAHINAALDNFDDDRTAAAAALGMSVATLYRRIGILQAKFGKRPQSKARGVAPRSLEALAAERETAEKAVADAKGDKKAAAAAAALGISVPTLYRRLKEQGVANKGTN